jgi:hypothetical protein
MRRAVCTGISIGVLVVPAIAQDRQPPTVTPPDYARAERFLAPAVAGLVVGGSVAANWTPDDRFSYRTTLADGSTQTILVDPARKTRTVCTADCPPAPAPRTPATSSDAKPLALSPDGKRAAFVRDWNL